MTSTRIFLVGGPADGKVLEVEGSPLDFRVPIVGALADWSGPVSEPTPIPVAEYRRQTGARAHDGKDVVLYVHAEGTPRTERRLVILAGSFTLARQAFEDRLYRGEVRAGEWRRATVVTNRHDAYRLRGLRGEDVRIIRGPRAPVSGEVDIALQPLLATGARHL